MEQLKLHDIQTLGDHLIQFQFSKKSLRTLISFSVFAILFSFSPMFPLFSHFLSSLSMQLSRFITDRNYIFIFFNGIMVFLIRNSSLDDTSSPKKSSDPHHQPVPEVVTEKRAREDAVEVEEDRGTENKNWDSSDSNGNESMDAEDDFVSVSEEEDEEEQEEIELLSAEELNKKCDDFIRKMREGIRTEAHRVMERL